MGRLTADQVTRESKKRDAAAVTSLKLSHRALSDVSCLSNFRNLEKLDLRCNCLVTLEGLSSCINLKWLSVAENKLESLKGIVGLTKLTVLNAGKNNLRKMDEVKSSTNLRALILNDNNISAICKLDQLEHLNTLVLSQNPILDIGDSLKKAKSITKLSLSHCELQNIGTSVVACGELKELRLAYNKITHIPPELTQNTKLQILDLGNNLIENWSDVKVLLALGNLKNLNLQGNPISGREDLTKKVKTLAPALQVLNSKKIDASAKTEKHSQKIVFTDDVDDFRSGAESGSTKKEKKMICNADVGISEVSSINAPREKRSKKSKSTSKLEQNDFNNVPIVASFCSANASKLFSVAEMKVEGVDDPEVSFLDALLPSDLNKPDSKGRAHEISADTKSGHQDFLGKKRRKGAVVSSAALQNLSVVPEVGNGGDSTWGD